MKSKNFKSLSSRIVVSIVLGFGMILYSVFFVYEKINREAFYNIEIEKVKFMAETVEPLIAVDIYLDMYGKMKRIASGLMQNQNILSVTILKDSKIIFKLKSPNYKNVGITPFLVKQPIFQPNSKIKIGTLILKYSDENYKKLRDKYAKLLILLAIALSIFFTFFAIYIRNLLDPLRKIAKLLKDYSPDKPIKFEYVKDNSEIDLISTALYEMQKKILEYSKQQQNINELLEKEVDEKTAQLREQLYKDRLTGLPNRHSLVNDIISIEDGALFVINIDDFKEVNDFYGQVVGDHVLIEFAKKLLDMFSYYPKIKACRLSGDEFALLFTQKPPLKEFQQLAQKLVDDIEKIIFIDGNNKISIQVTIGCAYQIQEALEKADIALKSARKEGLSCKIYDEKLNIEKQYENNMQWVKKLKSAMNDDRIVPFYQAIYDNKSAKVVSSECLIRLIDTDGTVISPFHFLGIAKKSRLYNQLTRIMVHKSCSYFENLDCDFSVNLSIDDILDSRISQYVVQEVQRYNVSKKIVFEILETEGIENYDEVSSFINDVKALGCRISIDDFGSGYSSFEHLLKLDIDYIKIDGTLIKNLDTDKNSQVVVETIVDFAKKLGKTTIAEFVHNEAVYEKVKELGVDRTQGYYFAEPKRELVLD